MRLIALILLAICVWCGPGRVEAHEVRPAYLEVTETGDGTIDVLFKQPAAGSTTVRLEPVLSGGLLDRPASNITAGRGWQVRTWRDIRVNLGGLGGRTLGVNGLDRSITDALVVVRYADGHTLQTILKPERSSIVLDKRGDSLTITTYFALGVGHILTGFDHLLFVLGLVLLVRGTGTLLTTITAFTIAHSITLAVTALKVIVVDSAKIEALVALSIIFVAVELINAARGKETLTQKRPWLIAFAFGLLHGTAFAGALSETGLPQANIPLALLLFNLGVEAGQLLFVGGVLAIRLALSRLPLPNQPLLARAPAYLIGTASCFWLFERLHAAVLP